MKKWMILTTALLFGFAVAGSVYGQDSTKTKSEIKQKTNKKTAGKETQNTEQPAHAQHFVDKDGDGYNDNAPDHDGDGIPNGLDPDWKKLQKSKLKKKQRNHNLSILTAMVLTTICNPEKRPDPR